MEVFIRKVPAREEEENLQKFFANELNHLQLEDWVLHKIQRKPFAKLIFLRPEDGERFLAIQARSSLRFKGRSLLFTHSKELPDAFAIRGLEMDRKARLNAKDHTVTTPNADAGNSEDFRALRCSSISCGIWQYDQLGFAFQPHFTLVSSANINFKPKAILFETDISQSLVFASQTVESTVWEHSSDTALTLTLREAPRISSYQLLDDFNSLLQSIFGDMEMPFQDKKRVTGLDKEHERITGACLVYRIIIEKEHGLIDLTKCLRLTRGLPSLAQRNVRVTQPEVSYKAQFENLLQHLTAASAALPFGVSFQLQKLTQNGYLPPLKVIDFLPEVENILKRSGSNICVSALRRLFKQIPYPGPDTEAKFFGLHYLTALLQRNETDLIRGGIYYDEPFSSNQIAIIHKATVTPTGVYLYGPDGECNNRVLRKYSQHHDSFLRVQFCDEDGQALRYSFGLSNKLIYERFKETLDGVISIAGRHFSFLGSSHSSLRSQSCWFMAPFSKNGRIVHPEDIIKDLGDFSHIRIPARCAARIGQAFSDTRNAITFGPGVIKDSGELADIKRNGRIFSDGVGTISQEALQVIWDRLRPGRLKPTVLQIRCRGSKGVVSLDPGLKGKSVFLRPSMIKFSGSTSTDIEICTAAYQPSPMRLNEQLIKILEDMGVNPRFFLDLQAKEIERLRSTSSSVKSASKFLKSQGMGDKLDLAGFLTKLQVLNISFQDDNFLTDVIETAVLIQLRTLKYKARIPVEKGYTLIGIMDETGILEEGQIFCIVEEDDQARVITGLQGQRVIVTRSPALHPGDIQRATAVTVPASSPLMKLRNCICFSQKGPRDLPSMLSGGDLDGDTFHIIFDPAIRTETLQLFPPADYVKVPPKEINRTVKKEDMTDFFVDFMETDQLGRICNTHKMLADQSPYGVNDSGCIKLAEMASTAVDFSKTGIPVNMNEMPRYSRWRPHFMKPGPYVEIAKEKPASFDDVKVNDDDDGEPSGFSYYPSEKILGKLFDAIDEQEIFQRIQHNSSQHALHGSDYGWDRNSSLLQSVWDHMQRSFPIAEWGIHLDRARGIREEYEDSLLDIMFEYGPRPRSPLSEIEVFIGDILGKNGALNTRQRELCISMKERFGEALSSAVKWIRDEDDHSEDITEPKSVLDLSMACLWLALNEEARQWESRKNRTSKLVSFGYVAAAICLISEKS